MKHILAALALTASATLAQAETFSLTMASEPPDGSALGGPVVHACGGPVNARLEAMAPKTGSNGPKAMAARFMASRTRWKQSATD